MRRIWLFSANRQNPLNLLMNHLLNSSLWQKLFTYILMLQDTAMCKSHTLLILLYFYHLPISENYSPNWVFDTMNSKRITKERVWPSAWTLNVWGFEKNFQVMIAKSKTNAIEMSKWPELCAMPPDFWKTLQCANKDQVTAIPKVS